MRRVSVIGTVGVPCTYGGFETLAENLVRYHAATQREERMTVYCEAAAYQEQPARFIDADLVYMPLKANGAQSVLYDSFSLLHALLRGVDVLLVLGVSGALVFPVVRLFSRARIITNVDGVEWKREKWSWLARLFLRLSEYMAVRWSHVVVADNQMISDYIAATYGSVCELIPYGGDHALMSVAKATDLHDLPGRYALALCRIEPENNVAMILQAFSEMPDEPLVFVGNWDSSDYGRNLRACYGEFPNLFLRDSVYDPGLLRWIRDHAWLYVHGHSAGGTNPSLVEMMHFGIPVIAYGCGFNRCTTEGAAGYFLSADGLLSEVQHLNSESVRVVGETMSEIARRRYRWVNVGRAYFELLEGQ